MTMLTALARPLLAGSFILGGLDAARSPGPRPQSAAKLGLPDSDLLVRANGAAMVAGGVALGVGYKPRLTSLLLIGTLVPTTLAGHRFWELDGEDARAQQMQFAKNAGLLGGLLAVLGTPSRGRLRRQRRRAKQSAKQAAKQAADS